MAELDVNTTRENPRKPPYGGTPPSTTIRGALLSIYKETIAVAKYINISISIRTGCNDLVCGFAWDSPAC